jgi:hypothetical protein
MEDSLGIEECPDVAVAERTCELVGLIKKLRSVSMHEEAEQIQLVLRRIDPAAPSLAWPWDTD